MKYITGHTFFGARYISEQLWIFSVGVAANEKDPTYMFAFFKHPGRDEWALEIEENKRIPIITNPDIEYSIAALLGLFAEDMTEQELINIPALIRARKQLPKMQQVVFLNEITPAAVLARMKTHEQIQADGWFGLPEKEEV